MEYTSARAFAPKQNATTQMFPFFSVLCPELALAVIAFLVLFFFSSFRSVIVPFLRVTARHSSRSHYIRLGGMDFVVPGDGALFSFEAETKFILIELCGPLSVRLSYQSCSEDCFVFVAHATQMSRHNVHCTRTEHKHVSVPLSPL